MKKCIKKPGIAFAFLVGVNSQTLLSQLDFYRYGIKSLQYGEPIVIKTMDGREIVANTGEWIVFAGGEPEVLSNKDFCEAYMDLPQ